MPDFDTIEIVDAIKYVSTNEMDSNNEEEIVDYEDTESFFENEISESTEIHKNILNGISRNVSKSNNEIIVVGQETVINKKPIISINKHMRPEHEKNMRNIEHTWNI